MKEFQGFMFTHISIPETFIGQIIRTQKSAGEIWAFIQRYEYNKEKNQLTKLRHNPPVPLDNYDVVEFKVDNPVIIYP